MTEQSRLSVENLPKSLLLAAMVGATAASAAYCVVELSFNGFFHFVAEFSGNLYGFTPTFYICLSVIIPGSLFGTIAGAISRRFWPKQRRALFASAAFGGVISTLLYYLLLIALLSFGPSTPGF